MVQVRRALPRAALRRAMCAAALTLLGATRCFADAQPPVVPLPAEVVQGQGAFAVSAATAVRVPPGDAEAAEAARFLVDLLARVGGPRLKVQATSAATSAAAAIVFARAPGFAPEGYQLEVTPREVRVTASTGAGLQYGAATLWQLVPPGRRAAEIPAQTIRDAPAYAWRGLMLDSARHFQSVEFIKRTLDWMAWHKLNVLHWHLTDDQGWRIEILKYPRLTSIGSQRVPATASSRKPPVYRGYYTQAEVRDIVAYATKRHIQVVPEIEMPGHAQAAVFAYPELGSSAQPAPGVSARWGVHTWLFNLEPQTFEFLERVLDEVMALFPGPYIHVGGDEAVKDQWKTSPAVQARARTLGIVDAEALQTWFTQQIGAYLKQHGRRLVGWDEILAPGLSSDAVVMSWRGTAGAHAAAVAGNDTVLSPWPTLYFDNRQSPLASEPPGRTKVISLEDVYRFEPRDPTLTPAQQQHVLGLQGNIWTEHIRSEERVEWMALPRIAAIAEIGWSAPGRRDFAQFLARVASTTARYRALGLHYADSVFAVDARIAAGDERATVTLANQGRFGDIRYSTDGRDPTPRSAAYATPLDVPFGTELRAATFAGDERVSGVWHRKLSGEEHVRRNSRELDLCSDGVSLLLEPEAYGTGARPLFAVDIMNPCWIQRDVDLTQGARITVTAGPLPFNFEIGADAQKIRVGDARTTHGELEVRVDGCDGEPVAVQPLAPPRANVFVQPLPPVTLPARPGKHDICLRFTRAQLASYWALDTVEIRP